MLFGGNRLHLRYATVDAELGARDKAAVASHGRVRPRWAFDARNTGGTLRLRQC